MCESSLKLKMVTWEDFWILVDLPLAWNEPICLNDRS